jgi:hypothetical protein
MIAVVVNMNRKSTGILPVLIQFVRYFQNLLCLALGLELEPHLVAAPAPQHWKNSPAIPDVKCCAFKNI